ncbi:MAG TPA: alpha/beta hydrolase [Patescibacteria group bacterium]|nr:alpha/beta hydrolase [Patescibacteria group bacterium]
MLKKEVIINGLKVNYLISSNFQEEQAIVFLPGWNSPAEVFSNQVKIDNLLAINLPGFFGSEKPQAVWGTSEYSLFLVELLNKLDIKNPILVGHSFGGAIALRYASDQPVNKLILIAAAIVRTKMLKIKIYYVGAKILKKLLPTLVKKLRKSFYEKIGSLDYLESGQMSDIYQKVISEDSQEYLKYIQNIPTTLIWGEDDLDTPLAQAHLIKKQLPNSHLFVLSNAAHYCFLDNKEEFDRVFQEELL